MGLHEAMQDTWFCTCLHNFAIEFIHVHFINNKLWLFFFSYNWKGSKFECAKWITMYQPLELNSKMRKNYFIIYFDNIRHFNEPHFFCLCFKDVTTLWIRIWFFHLYFVGIPSRFLWNNCKLYLLESVLCLSGYIWGFSILEGNVLNVHWFSQLLHGE